RDRDCRGDAHLAQRRPRQEHAQGVEGRRASGHHLPPAPARAGRRRAGGPARRRPAADRRRRARGRARSHHRAERGRARRPRDAAAADDRLRHQASRGDARDAQNRSESDGQLRDPARAAGVADDVNDSLTNALIDAEDIMTPTLRSALALTAMLALTGPAAAQPAPDTVPRSSETPAVAAGAPATTEADAAAEAAAAAESAWKKGRPIVIQYYRPLDQRGTNVFETTKEPGVEYTGFKLDFGAAFTSQVQNLSHRNSAAPNVVAGVNTNQLADIGFGFNNSTANLALNAQLAPGIRVALTSYLSSRHHNETWVKDGYIQIDQSPIDLAPLKMLFEIVTVR